MSDHRATDIEVANTGLLPETPEAAAPPDGDRQPSPRELAMERIAANYERQRQRELDQAGEAGNQEAGVAANGAQRPVNPSLGELEEDREYEDPYVDHAEPAATTRNTQPSDNQRGAESGQVQAQPPAQRPTAPELISVQVDGQQFQVTQEQLIQLARVGMIANHTVDQFQRMQQAPVQQPAPQPQQRQEQPQALFDQERVRQAVKRIQFGSEDEGTSALSELIGDVVQRAAPRPAPPTDVVAIANQAARMAIHHSQSERDKATIQAEYGEILADPQLSQLAAINVGVLKQEAAMLGVQKSDLEIYREAGNRVFDALRRPRPGVAVEHPAGDPPASPASQAPNVVVRRAATDARKREAPRSMSQVIDRRALAPETPRAPSGSDIVDMMRKARGQTSMK